MTPSSFLLSAAPLCPWAGRPRNLAGFALRERAFPCHTKFTKADSAAQISEAIARYDKLLEQDGFRDLAWAEKLQDCMRQRGLTDSGRIVAPVLRPQFISGTQLDLLTRTSEQFVSVLSRFKALVLESPALLNRLGMLPAEKMLAAIPSGNSLFPTFSCLDVQLQNGSVSISGYETAKPKALAYFEPLAELFLDLPISKAFRKGFGKLSGIGAAKRLVDAIRQTWKNWGGRSEPNVAILEFNDASGSCPEEAQLLAAGFNHSGLATRLFSPTQLRYANGRLQAEEFEIDIAFRRFRLCELLARFDLSHPLLTAYRDRAVCLVNDFTSEITYRLTLFELLTDEAVTASLAAEDRQLLRKVVPWTRAVARKKTKYKEQDVDLPDFITRHRAQLVLRPNEQMSEQPTFVGSEMTAAAWDSALRVALRTAYVVQERCRGCREQVPVLQYGERQIKQACVTVHSYMFNGKLGGAVAALETYSGGYATPLAFAPLLLLHLP